MSTAVEKFIEAPPEITERQLEMIERQANTLAKSNLVGPELRGKPADIVMIGLTSNALEVPMMTGLSQIFPIKGRAVLSAQLKLALAQRSGHEVWFEQTDARSATICGKRRGSERVHTVTVKHEDYKHLHGKDVWKQYPAAMLRARAVTALFTMAFTDVLLGMPVDVDLETHIDQVPEEAYVADTEVPRQMQVEDPDDDIPDAELVDPEEISGGGDHDGSQAAGDKPGQPGSHGDVASSQVDPPAAPAGASPEMADDWDREALRNAIAKLPPHLKDVLANAWADAGWGSVKENAPEDRRITEEHGEEAWAKVRLLERAAKAEWADRRKHANAAMNEVGVKKDDDRHAFVREATGGETESTGQLSEEQLERILTTVQHRKDEAALAAEQDAAAELDQQLEYADNDPERPFD